jgi:hypothetical protein
VKTDFGFHLIKVEEREDALTRPLESVREEIAKRAAAARGAARSRASAAQQLADAVRGGQDARGGRARAQTSRCSRAGGSRARPVIPGLGNAPEVLAAAFVLEPGKSSPHGLEARRRTSR